jgi:hypothetical protein
MVILTDDQQEPMSIPTKNNILKAMSWLVSGVQPNDSLFFHYSGRMPLDGGIEHNFANPKQRSWRAD